MLSWNAHTSPDVIAYIVQRNGVEIGRTNSCTYADRDLTTGVPYAYNVYGITADERTTEPATISVTPKSPQINMIKTDNVMNKIGVSRNTIYAYVRNDNNLQPLGDDQTVGKFYVVKEEDRELIGTAELSASLGSASVAVYTVQWDISEVEDGEYTVAFVLTDVDGTAVETEKTVIVDRRVPDQIIGVTAISDVTVIYLNWSISSEIDTTIYRIYRRPETDAEFRLIAQINDRNTLSYTDNKVKPEHIYYYYVVGVNDFGQESTPSEVSGATLSEDLESPMVVKLTPSNSSYLTGEVEVSLSAHDNVSVTKSQLYLSTDEEATWTLLAEKNSGALSSRINTRELSDGVIYLKGIAYDAAGNQSTPLVYVYSIDNNVG